MSRRYSRGGNEHRSRPSPFRRLDLNRELPPLPADMKAPGRVLQVDTSIPFLPSARYEPPAVNAKTSSTATRSSGFSSKQEFRHITAALLNVDSMKEYEERPAAFEPLEPTKFNPSDMSKPLPKLHEAHLYVENRFLLDTSTAQRQTRWPASDMSFRSYSPPPFLPLPSSMKLPQSQSDGNFQRVDPSKSSIDLPRRRANSQDDIRGLDSSSPSASNRGRRLHRTPSPTKHLENVDEEDDDAAFTYSGSHPKRPQSPSKKLFGENGWLGHSPSIKSNKKTPLKSLSEKFKQRVEGFAEGVKTISNSFHRENIESPEPVTSTFPVSLNPPAQSRLYAEMELMICVAANKFLMAQHQAGRLSYESIKKVIDHWQEKNRPQVIEFQFDQATQRDLILLNIKTCEFHGEANNDGMTLSSILYSWRSVAKEMSIRTFCTPDSVVRKHLHDIRKILEMLGAHMLVFVAFQELQFTALGIMAREHQKHVTDNQHRVGSSMK